jgi:pimeloyl-ACP methyl ester carboxylesterase
MSSEQEKQVIIVDDETVTVSVNEIDIHLADGLRMSARDWRNVFKGEQSSSSLSTTTFNVLALHGWLDNASTFDELLPRLLSKTKHSLRVVAVDLIGHGHSDHRPKCSEYTPASYCIDIVQALSALGWRSNEAQFGFVAHSMGASVASRCAALLGESCKFVALFDALGGGPASSAKDQIDRFAAQVLGYERLIARPINPYPSVDACVARLCEHNKYLSRHASAVLCSRGVGPLNDGTDRVAFLGDRRLIGRTMRFREDEIRELLSRLHAPVLVVLAEHRWYPFDQALFDERAKLVPNLRTHLVAGSHHHVHLDQHVDECTSHALDFIDPLLS